MDTDKIKFLGLEIFRSLSPSDIVVRVHAASMNPAKSTLTHIVQTGEKEFG
jgi:hypothetical protein